MSAMHSKNNPDMSTDSLRLVQRFSDYIENTPQKSSIIHRSLKIFAKTVEELTKKNIYITSPFLGNDYGIKPEYIAAAQALKKEGVIDFISKAQSLPDDPYLFWFEGYDENVWISAGADLKDQSDAFIRALGEYVERTTYFKGTDLPSIKSSYTDLKKPAVNPAKIAGFSDKQKQANKRLQYTEDTEFTWLLGYNEITQKETYIPKQCIEAVKNEPLIRHPITTGLASYFGDREKSILNGILEVIERDAFMITYLNHHTPQKLNQGKISDHELKSKLEEFRLYNLEVHLLVLTTDFPVQATAAIIVDHSDEGPAVSVGLGTGASVEKSAYSALVEAHAIRSGTRTHFLSTNKNIQSTQDKPDLKRLLYWSEKGREKDINWFLSGDTVDPSELEVFDETKLLSDIKKFCGEKNYPIITVDLTPKKIKKHGWCVIFSFIPQLQPFYLDDDLPCFGGERLNSVAKDMGFECYFSEDIVSIPFV